MAIIPNAIAGGIGGFVGVRLTFLVKPLKQADYEIVAYAMSAIVVLISALGIFVAFRQDGMSIGIVENISNGVGIIFGLFMAQQAVRDDQRSVTTGQSPAPTT
jgi:hypothetical protein